MNTIEHQLEQALKGHTEPPGKVPEQVDEAVRSMLQARAGHIRATRGRRTPWTRALRYAAAMLVGVLLATVAMRLTDRTPSHAPIVRQNSERPVDITDAYALTCRIDNGQTVESDDINHDGRVDQIDVDTLARRAVRIRS